MNPAVSVALLAAAFLASTTIRPAVAAEIDPQLSRIGFSFKTRWGQVLRGRFPKYEGRVESLDDGRERVHLRLDARAIEIVGYPSYTSITRGDGFFEADRFPEIEFVSEPYAERLTVDGGKLAGMLRIRDVRRREIFEVEPAECARPGLDCDVVTSGTVRRREYGVDRWLFAVSDVVRFQLRLRVRETVE